MQVSGSDGAAEVSVTDAIPACHSFISLAPVLEAALSQVTPHSGRGAFDVIVDAAKCVLQCNGLAG